MGVGKDAGNHQNHQHLQHQPLESGIDTKGGYTRHVDRIKRQRPGLLKCCDAFSDEYDGQQGQQP
jgi:hypothetical protein